MSLDRGIGFHLDIFRHRKQFIKYPFTILPSVLKVLFPSPISLL